MSWFNTYKGDGDGLTRTVLTTEDLSDLPLLRWTDNELGFRLAFLYPQVDGYGHLTAPEEVKVEIRSLMKEIERRGYDSISNLRLNERCTGWGWLPGFDRKTHDGHCSS